MSVEFNEEDQVLVHQRPQQKASLLTRIVYKLKLADSEAGAQRVLLIAALCCLGAAVYLFLNLTGIL